MPGTGNDNAWVVRPIVWFTATWLWTTILHELTHACVARAMGVRSTLFHDFVDLSLTPSQAATGVRAVIAAAGPLFCLALGLLALFAVRRVPGPELGLPFTYLTVFGIGTFFGNLMSTSFVGDFSFVAVALGLPMELRYAITGIGALCAAAIHFWGGRKLVQWAPARAGRMAAMIGMIATPVVLGTAVVILASQPMIHAPAAARLAEAGLWIFAALGGLTVTVRSVLDPVRLRVRWADGVAIVLAVLVFRLMSRGIPFVP
jgi:hypothetical protein